MQDMYRCELKKNRIHFTTLTIYINFVPFTKGVSSCNQNKDWESVVLEERDIKQCNIDHSAVSLYKQKKRWKAYRVKCQWNSWH